MYKTKMELYTKTNLKRLVAACGLILIMPVSSCKKMDDQLINTDTKKLKPGPYVAGSYITGMMQSIIKSSPEWWAQLQQNLNADLYSGYMATGSAFNGGSNNNTYHMMDGWNGFVASTPYDYVLNPWLDVKKETMDKEKELYAISLIIKVSAAHRLTDVFGPIPYTQLGMNTAPAFDSQETVYNAFFSELKQAVDILTAAEDGNPSIDQVKFAPYDVSTFGGDFKLWTQYANSLRLRLAMRVSNVKPALAKEQAEAAVNHKYGVLQSTPFAVACGGPHYLATLSNTWNDILLNADMECYLNGFKDPRAVKFALPATAPASVAGKIKGIRNGIQVLNKSYKGYSFLNFNPADKVLLMTAAESYFLRAEGALKGWNMGGTAQSFYEAGISKSFDQYGLGGVTTYLNDATSTPTAYVDPVDPSYDKPRPSDVTIQWDESATEAKKLEKIITQKWIAVFPDGQEAWSEFRRTTYPKLFPNEVNESGGQVPAGKFIRRLPYPSYFTTSNPGGVAAAVSNHLGGPDQMGTPLWWDKN
jgi:hypothetical protein